jgi:hypothetical protein
MSVSRRLAAALAVVGAGVLAYAVPASATGNGDGHGGGGKCIENPRPSDLEGHLDAESGTAWVRAKDGRAVCSDVLLSIYKVPDTWNGHGFNDTAVPQQVIATDRATLKGNKKVHLQVPVPDCGNVQIDLYLPPELKTVDISGHPGSQYIAGYIWSPGSENGHPKDCKPPTTSPTTPCPTPTTPSPTPTTPSATPTTTAPVTPTASPTSGLGAPIPVPPQQAPPAPPVLAETGSNSTIPLIGLGGFLLVAGIGLSLVGRKPRTA